MYVKLIIDFIDFSEQCVLFLFFPKLRGRFTHGTVRANVFFSDNFNVFLKGGTKKGILLKDLSFIKYLNNITQEWGGGGGGGGGGGQEFIKASH